MFHFAGLIFKYFVSWLYNEDPNESFKNVKKNLIQTNVDPNVLKKEIDDLKTRFENSSFYNKSFFIKKHFKEVFQHYSSIEIYSFLKNIVYFKNEQEISVLFFEYFKKDISIGACLNLLQFLKNDPFYTIISDEILFNRKKETEIFVIEYFKTEIKQQIDILTLASIILNSNELIKLDLFKKLHSSDHINIQLNLGKKYLESNEKLDLFDYFRKSSAEQQYNLLNIFLQHSHIQTIDFLYWYINLDHLNKIFTNKSTIEALTVKKANDIISKLIKSLCSIKELKEAYAFCCFRRTKVVKNQGYSILVCPICGESKFIKPNFPKITIGFVDKDEEGYFNIFHLDSIRIIHANEFIVTNLEQMDVNKILIHYYNESLNLNINKDLKYIFQEVEIDENTKRVLKINQN